LRIDIADEADAQIKAKKTVAGATNAGAPKITTKYSSSDAYEKDVDLNTTV